MLIKDFKSNLEFILISKESVSYEATDSHLANIRSNDFVEISFWHDGRVSFTFGSNGVCNHETCKFYEEPTAEDLYNFVEIN